MGEVGGAAEIAQKQVERMAGWFDRAQLAPGRVGPSVASLTPLYPTPAKPERGANERAGRPDLEFWIVRPEGEGPGARAREEQGCRLCRQGRTRRSRKTEMQRQLEVPREVLSGRGLGTVWDREDRAMGRSLWGDTALNWRV